MPSRKITIATDLIENFLINNFCADSKVVSEFSGNENARAFLFTSGGKEFVIKVDNNIKDFEKDKYAYVHFFKKDLVIPEIIKLGNITDKVFYSIAKKLPGKALNKLSNQELDSSLSQICSTLALIHSTDISKTKGYGAWDVVGNALRKSWKEHILQIKQSDYFSWDKLFKEGIFEKELFDISYKKILSLIEFLSEERSLIHGDYGFNNVLVESNKVTGVLDWALSKYGDFIYDIAWLSYWEDRINYASILKYYHKNKDLKNYDERLLCYLLHIGISTMVFSAKFHNRKGYEDAKKRLLKFL